MLWDDHRERIKVIATGSSAFYIDEKFNDSLAGRKKIFNLYTCTFEEALYLRGDTQLLQEFRRIRLSSDAKSLMLPQLRAAFFEYMRFGGYPEVIMTESESEKTVQRYMKVMAKSFHICLVKPFFKNIDKELVKMPMVYFMDSGMRNALVNNFLPIIDNPTKGQIWENQVFRILADKHDADYLRFWRTTDKKEVDFILPSTNPPQAIEVKSDNSKARASSYKSFTKTYPELELKFYCLDPFNEDLLRCL